MTPPNSFPDRLSLLLSEERRCSVIWYSGAFIFRKTQMSPSDFSGELLTLQSQVELVYLNL